jgi:hypothetical protein
LLQLVQAAKGFDQRILDQFGGIMGIAQETKGNGGTLPLILLGQRAESLPVAGFGGKDQV